MSKRAKKTAAPPKPRFPFVVECYGDPTWMIPIHTHQKPSSVNSLVVDRFRITIERVDEPPEVILERMRVLWRTSERNIHRRDAFYTRARELGLSEPETMFDLASQGIDYKPKR